MSLSAPSLAIVIGSPPPLPAAPDALARLAKEKAELEAQLATAHSIIRKVAAGKPAPL